ncbi:MAG: hypothetical protein ACLSC9_10055 [Barnesiella sp.]
MFVIVFLAISWFFCGRKVESILCFFFFLLDGFQIIPLSWFSLGIGLKPMDYALAYLLGIFVITVLTHNMPVWKDKIMPKFSYLFMAFLVAAIIVSRYFYAVPWGEILRTVRNFILLLSCFLFYRLSIPEIDRLKKIIFYITLCLSGVYILQAIIGAPILNGYAGGAKMDVLGVTIPRYYNFPILLPYFIYYGLYQYNYHSNRQKIFISILLFLPILLSFHRNLIISIIFILVLNIYLYNKFSSKSFKYTLLFILILLPSSGMIYDSLNSRGTINDVKAVMEGDFEAFSRTEDFAESTLLLRMSMLYERTNRMLETPLTTYMGLGLMQEATPYTMSHFDFVLGIRNEDTGEIMQVETSDIAWITLFVRFGLLGTVIYLIYYCNLFLFFWKGKDAAVKRTVCSYMLLMLITSITNIMICSMAYIVPILLEYTRMKKLKKQEPDLLKLKENE